MPHRLPRPGSVTLTGIPAGASCSSSRPPGRSARRLRLGRPPHLRAGNDRSRPDGEMTVTNLLAEQQAGEILTVEKSNNAPVATAAARGR